ncbi:Hypothetical protein SRAE_1000008900 [Strongyloides ratti]|uniref:Nudix hydrolase domain-containing protein n=1 Tax=Strongyloides ratti TaxID=34506 RepID=A0A090MTW6_STRRB|nr:Hypothetical protein SRAE_1000008900 [Strongyloides ratti]CEF61813.1 Hypothetical protein SRAE_1000008900 [Strongyloides ratti]
MKTKNFVRGAITILYSKNSEKILVGEKKVNTLYLSNSLGFPGALLQPGIDEQFDYRKTNLDKLSKNNIFKSDKYGRSIAAARGLFIELGILPIIEGISHKTKIETAENYPLYKSYKDKVENYPSTFMDLFVTKSLDIKSFVSFTNLQLNTKNNIFFDFEVFVLPINDLTIIDKISTNVGKFHWVSADTIPGLKKLFNKNQLNISKKISLQAIKKSGNGKDVLEINQYDYHFQEVITRVNNSFGNTSNSLEAMQYK